MYKTAGYDCLGTVDPESTFFRRSAPAFSSRINEKATTDLWLTFLGVLLDCRSVPKSQLAWGSLGWYFQVDAKRIVKNLEISGIINFDIWNRWINFDRAPTNEL